jgi:hypothetical protein
VKLRSVTNPTERDDMTGQINYLAAQARYVNAAAPAADAVFEAKPKKRRPRIGFSPLRRVRERQVARPAAA